VDIGISATKIKVYYMFCQAFIAFKEENCLEKKKKLAKFNAMNLQYSTGFIGL